MTEENQKQGYSVFNLRLSNEFKKTLKDVAKQNNRSLHGEIMYRLEKSIHRPQSTLSLKK